MDSDLDLSVLTTREREVVLAAAEGQSTKELAERLFLSARTVEHHLSSAYRKLDISGRTALVAALRVVAEEPVPVTRYANNAGVHIAYQVVGDGPSDLMMVPGFISNVETAWTWPSLANFLRRLSEGRRLIIFDKRGTGLSDPVTDPAAHTLEQRMEDARTVLDAAGSRRAALFGFSEGAAVVMLLAATYPARVSAMVLYGGLISPTIAPEKSVFSDPERAWQLMQQLWGTGGFLAPFVPSLEGNAAQMAHVARFERHGASPAAAFTIFRLAATVELRSLCPVVRVPTLVAHRRNDVLVPSDHGRYLADHLPDARYLELEGSDHPPWVGQNDHLFDKMRRFLTSDHPVVRTPTRLLQAIVLADPPLAPSLLSTMERFRGRPASAEGGVVHVFEGAVRAVECALTLRGRQAGQRLLVHAGELEMTPQGVAGVAVRTALRLLPAIEPGRVTVTSMVKDLTQGAGLRLLPCPPIALKPEGPIGVHYAELPG